MAIDRNPDEPLITFTDSARDKLLEILDEQNLRGLDFGDFHVYVAVIEFELSPADEFHAELERLLRERRRTSAWPGNADQGTVGVDSMVWRCDPPMRVCHRGEWPLLACVFIGPPRSTDLRAPNYQPAVRPLTRWRWSS